MLEHPFVRWLPPFVQVKIMDNGWCEPDVIIGIVSAALTLGAIVVALVSNHISQKTLKATLKIQEQNKNVSLYDGRMNVVNKIKKNPIIGKSIYDDVICDIRILFGEDVVLLLDEYEKQKEDAECIEREIARLQEFMCANGYREIWEKIVELEDYIREDPFGEEMLRDFCWKNKIPHQDEVTHKTEYYDYYVLRTERNLRKEKAEESKKKLIESMLEWISRSIQPVK